MSVLSAIGDWTAGKGPLYRRLADRIDELVAAGELRPGELLPPERALAEALVVSRSTTVAAYALLRERGTVVRRQGSGTRIAERAPAPPGRRLGAPGGNELFRHLGADDEDLIDLATVVLPQAPEVGAVLRDLDGPELQAILDGEGYLPQGLPALRRAIADDVSRQVPTSGAQVLITTGAQQAISLVTSLLVEPGDAVVTEEASYAGALDIFRAAGARVFGVRGDSQGIDVTDLERVVARTRPAMIYLVPTHSNPTGTVLPVHRREAIVEIARRHQVPVVDDLALSQLHLDENAGTPLPLAYFAETGSPSRRTDLVISIDSLAKTFWGGLRLGWVRASPGLISRLVRAKTMGDLGSPPVMQLVAARLMTDADAAVERRNVELRARYADTVAQLADLLPDWEYHRPRGGPVLWLRLPAGSGRGLAATALRHGVTVAPGPAFSPSESFTDHVRLPFSGPPEARRVGVERLAAAWAAYEPGRDAVEEPARPLL